MTRSVILGAGLMAAGSLLLGASSVQAQVPLTAKCTAAKIKCVTGLTTADLKCHEKAEGKGVAVDPACTSKADIKFTDTVTNKGCMEKAESKPPCATTGDAAAIQADSDAFVNDIVTDVDPLYPTPVLDKCSAGKKKCVGNKVKSLLGCYGKDVTKPDPVKFNECIAKAQAKFDGGVDPSKGCFEKLEAKYPPASATPCQTFDDTAAVEAKVDAYVAGIASDLAPPVNPTTLDFATGAPGGTCGTAKDGAMVTVKNLTCGGLNIGGGGSVVAEGPTPDGSVSRFSLSCTGNSCTIGPTNAVPPVNTGGPDCTDVGCNFGTPLPIPNPAIPSLTTCVHNTWASPASGTLDLGTGVSSTNVNLTSDIYLTGNLAQPCPQCSGTGSPASPGTGTCDRGPRATMACTSTNSDGYSRDCPSGGVGSVGTPCPGGPGNGSCPANNCPCTVGGGNCCDGSHVGPINVNLSPLTTGAASDTDAGGIFCPGQTSAGCFGQGSCRTITENGAPAGPITVGTPSSATLASVFCIAASGNGLVDASAALPGPGAVSLPGTFEVN